MPVYSTLPRKGAYGYPLGLIALEERRGFALGDALNAASYDFPVYYRVVGGATPARVARGDRDLESAIVDAARAIETQGARAIVGGSSVLGHYQSAVVSAVRIPVLLTSLFQLDFISLLLDPGRSIGVIAADSTLLDERLLSTVGVPANRKIVIKGMERQPAFRRSVLDGAGDLDTDEIGAEIVEMAKRLLQENPDIGAILLEGAMMPPYSAAVQRATSLPVFDVLTLIRYLKKSTHQTSYRGYY